jgi:hypothetical protein
MVILRELKGQGKSDLGGRIGQTSEKSTKNIADIESKHRFSSLYRYYV